MNGASDQQLEIAVGRVLRLGIMASSTCLGAGLVMALTGNAFDASRVLAAVGLVLLMSTPAARLLVATLKYARQQEWTLVGFTLIVMAELVLSVFAAFHGWG